MNAHMYQRDVLGSVDKVGSVVGETEGEETRGRQHSNCVGLS